MGLGRGNPQQPNAVSQWGNENSDKLLALAGLVGGMSHKPNQAVQQLGQLGAQGIQQKRDSNATIDWLMKNGHEDLAQLVKDNPSMAKQAVAQGIERSKPKGKSMSGAQYLESQGIDPKTVTPEFLSRVVSVNPDGTPKILGGNSGTTVNVGGEINPGFKKYMENVGTTVADWQQTGRSDAYAQLAQMTDAINALSSGEAKTGLVYGSLPEWAKAFYDGNTKQAQDQIEEVVQRNLRTILGAQFTEREGTRLIARAFNDKLRPEQNLQRLNKLMTQMKVAADAKDQMTSHFMSNQGDMRGFEGAVPSLQSFHEAFDTMDVEQGIAAPRVSTQEAFDALPSGSEYIGTDGKRYRKP